MAKSKQTKYIVVTGGVLSGIGKGITAASLGALLNCVTEKITVQKLEPYFNVDSGTLNPKKHGECFVTADGKETDLDLGHYERFIGRNLNKNCVILSGGIYQEMLARERAGFYEGNDVQLVPHITNLIQEKILEASGDSDVHIMELGGTIGDYESLGYIEALREMTVKFGRENFVFCHVGFVPFLKVSSEFKTKPLQNSVRDLRHYGITPDLIVARCEEVPKNNYIERKIAPFVGVAQEQIIVLPNADTIYRVPETLWQKNVHEYILDKFKFKWNKKSVAKKMKERWGKVLDMIDISRKSAEVKIGVVAKYLDNMDSYYSVVESLKIASGFAKCKLKIEWIDSEKLEKMSHLEIKKIFDDVSGILVPGGFGSRGVEGKILAASYALEHNKPYMGICLGLQVAVIAAARRAGIKNANSEEFDTRARGAGRNVVYIMDDQVGKENTGGTMRLGTYKCFVEKDTLAEKVFANSLQLDKEKSQGRTSRFIEERHRHRYEVNQKFQKEIEKGGVKFSGFSKDRKLVELIERVDGNSKGAVFFLATQSHPEFLSRPWAAHPMFLEFVRASVKK